MTPTLFGIFLFALLREAMQHANLADPGVRQKTRFDANVYSASRLKAKTKTTEVSVPPSPGLQG